MATASVANPLQAEPRVKLLTGHSGLRPPITLERCLSSLRTQALIPEKIQASAKLHGVYRDLGDCIYFVLLEMTCFYKF